MVSYLYDPAVRAGMGGFQKVLELAAQFGRRHKVTVFAPSYSRRHTEIDCVWVPVIDKPLLRLISFNLLLIPAMLYRCARGRPHIIYERIFNALAPPLLAWLLGARLVIEFNGNPLQFYRTDRKPRGKWVKRVVSWNLRRADRIVALTEGLKSEIRSDFNADTGQTFVAPSGSNSSIFYPHARAECRRELGISENVRLAVFTGTFFAYQGIDTLLEALADPRLYSLETWLAGEGRMRAAWEARAAALGLTKVRFTGQIEYHQVPVMLGAADFCLAPFDPDRGEVSPLKVIDYLFCARPTVISDIPPVQNLIRQFPSLLSFQAGNPQALANTIHLMLERIGHYTQLAALDSQKARAEFSWEQIALKIEEHSFT